MIRKNFIFVFIAFFCFSHIQAQAARPGIKVVRSVGESRIKGKDVTNAKKRALSDALTSAVAQVALDVLPQKLVEGNFKTISKILFAHSNEFVEKYNVITGTGEGGTYRLLAEITVTSDKIKKQVEKAGFMEKKKIDLPKILLLITEKSIDDLMPHYWWGSNPAPYDAHAHEGVAAVFMEKGFEVVDINTRLEDAEDEQVKLDKPYLTPYEVSELANRYQAQIVIYGKAISQNALNVMGDDLKSYKGSLDIKVLMGDTGETIAVLKDSAVVTSADELEGGNQALAAIGTAVGKDLAIQVQGIWEEKVSSVGKITIVVGGTKFLGNFVMFRRALNEMPKAKNMQIVEMKADESTISVDYQGEAQELADDLMQNTFDNFGIHVYEVDTDQIRIELVPAQQTQE